MIISSTDSGLLIKNNGDTLDLQVSQGLAYIFVTVEHKSASFVIQKERLMEALK